MSATLLASLSLSALAVRGIQTPEDATHAASRMETPVRVRGVEIPLESALWFHHAVSAVQG